MNLLKKMALTAVSKHIFSALEVSQAFRDAMDVEREKRANGPRRHQYLEMKPRPETDRRKVN